MPGIKIVPSILSANQDRINEEIREVEPYSDLLQVDVMDNKFVPNKTPGPEYLKKLETKAPLDIHLMVEEPSNDYIKSFLEANKNLRINNVTVHVEACSDLKSKLSFIKSLNVVPSVAINPDTPVGRVKGFLDDVGMVLVMTVHPGFSGQEFLKEAMPKVEEIRKLKPELDIEVDGGVNNETAPIAVMAGANVLVASSYIFKSSDKAKSIKELKEAVQ